MTEVKNELVTLNDTYLPAEVSPELLEFLGENAGKGVEELNGESMPILKVTEPNSRKNILTTGAMSTVGKFYYTPTKQEFDSPEVQFLAFSRGFYALEKSESGEVKKNADGTNKTKFTQLAYGVFSDDYLPFVIFIKGIKLAPFWQWSREELSKLTKRKQNAIPVFMIKVKLDTRLVKHAEGSNFTIDYKILTNPNGKLDLLTDVPTLRKLAVAQDKAMDSMSSYIGANEVNKDGTPLNEKPTVFKNDDTTEFIETTVVESNKILTDDVDPDDIPF